jgi:pyruvate formate-lyase activating enzyme-like uncharacterized protein
MDWKEIGEEVGRLQIAEPNLDALRPAWAEYLARAKQQVPGVRIEGDGEVVHLGELSPGCRACKVGTWDCIFTTLRCNLDCEFCYSPLGLPREYAGSAFGRTPEEIADNHARTRITGISFSGGEPFMDAPKLLEWVGWFKERCPDMYTWVYTNGLLAEEVYLRRLGELGVDEIRFNMAATGYDHPAVLENLATAARFMPNVTVEIPAIPAHTLKVLACLGDWCALGARFLNLHELIYESGSRSAGMDGPRQEIITEDGHRSAFNPESRELTLAVMKRVQEEGLPLAVNDCSMQSKLRQLRGRRRSLAPLVQGAHERLVEDQFYESYCAHQGGEAGCWLHPGTLDEARERLPDYRFVRLVRTAPLTVRDSGRWMVCEELKRGVEDDTAGQ